MELTGDDLSMFSNFEKITHVMPSDYLNSESTIIFLVSQESLGKSIGKNAQNIQKLGLVFRKRVIIIADSDDMEMFIRNFFGNIGILDMDVKDIMGEKNVTLIIDEKDRGIAIGRNGERIKAAKSFLKKKFNATVSVKTRRASI
ncbi:MAG TPA: NusA-like transcription termination signal-binding factor [Candidatus Bilamarchaeum sp.]|nr:NusA-like transcription termination signal-binding factor [Candidatus Bilamarchaeum sp.]